MADELPPSRPSRPWRQLRSARLEAFSDGVFAIAITLLVLEIAVPAGAERDLLGAILHLWPSYLAYVVSFATIGAVWMAHVAVTEYLDHADIWLLRLNLGLLLVVALLPFPTRMLAENLGGERAERVATTVYGLVLLATSVLLWVLWRYAVRAQLVRPDADDADIQLLTKRLTPGLVSYLVLIVLGMFLPVAAVAGYLAIALYYLLPIRRRRSRR